MKKHNGAAAIAAVIGAGVLWGLLGSFGKILSGYGFQSLQIQGIRVGLGSLIFLAILLAVKPRLLRIDLKDIWMFIGTGIISTALFGVCYFYTGIHSETSVAVILLYTSPVFVMLLSAVFFGEKITRHKLAALVMTFIGCILVAGVTGGESHLTPVTLATGLASGFFYALYSIFGKYALKKYEALTVTAYTFFCAAVVLIPLSDVPEIIAIYVKQPAAFVWSISASLFCSVLSYFLYSWGLARMESGRAAILVTTEPLVGAILGMVLFRESHGVLKIVGIALIIGAILLLARKSTDESEVQPKER